MNLTNMSMNSSLSENISKYPLTDEQVQILDIDASLEVIDSEMFLKNLKMLVTQQMTIFQEKEKSILSNIFSIKVNFFNFLLFSNSATYYILKFFNFATIFYN